MAKKQLHILAGSLLLLLIFALGCAKEYSYEHRDVVVGADTLNPAPPWICPACIGNDTYQESRWSFHSGNILFCGIIDTAIVNLERTGFTFFGPSSCSIDTGMIITVYLNGTILDSDKSNIMTQRSGFIYYDNVGNTDIYITKPGNPFTVTIDSYVHQTRMATGTFSGLVVTANGGGSVISSGKFKIKLI